MFQNIQVLASYTVLEAIRNRLLWLVSCLIIIALVFSAFAGNLALTESAHFQVSIASFLLRIGAVVLASLLVVSGTIRDFADKNHELVLSTAVTRSQFFMGRLLGYLMVSTLIGLCSGIPLLLYAPVSATVTWMISIALEVCLITTLSLVLALILSNLTLSVLVVLIFYILSRSMPAIDQIAHSPAVDQAATSTFFVSSFIDILSYLLPNLGDFGLGEWLYKEPPALKVLGIQVFQTGIYIALLSGMALIDFNRKNI